MLRPATDDDVDVLLRWRNHPTVRAVSLTRHVIGADEHRAWWARTSADPARRVLVYGDPDPVGVVVFADIVDDAGDGGGRSASWSFYLDVDAVEAGGHTLRAWFGLEREAIAYATEQLGVTLLHGVTLASNGSVRQLHRRFGFTESPEYDVDVDGVPTPVVYTELRTCPS